MAKVATHKMTQPEPMPQSPDPKGSLMVGCLMGTVLQIAAFFLVMLVDASAGHSAFVLKRETLWRNGLALLLVCQWTILIPLIRRARARGETDTRRGLILAAIFGALSGTAFALALVGG